MWHTFAFILVIFSPAVLAQKPTKAPVDLQQLRKQIERNQHEYMNHPSKSLEERKQENAVTQEYVNLVVQKIEIFGNKSYPGKTRSQAYGDVLVTIELKSSGEISNVSIEKTSGHPELDELAVSAVQSSAPFEPFEKWDTIKFTKLFSFVSCTNETKRCLNPITAVERDATQAALPLAPHPSP